jgi:hypothetical protein
MTCQSSFGAALLDPEAPPPPGLTDAQGRPAAAASTSIATTSPPA